MTPGAKLKAAVLATYQLDSGETVLLDQAVELCDALDRVNHAVAHLEELTTTGSAGQTVEHPLLVAQRSYSLTLTRLIEGLRLPAPGAPEEDEGESKVTLEARRAARARWDRQKASRG